MNPEPFLSVHALGKHLPPRRARGTTPPLHWIIRDITFELDRGLTLALVGPSGGGKSTLARCLAGLETPNAGDVHIEGRRPGFADVQLIPQQPAASFNPRFTAEEAVGEPLVIQRCGNEKDRLLITAGVMKRVRLPLDSAAKPVTEFSGGEHQRLAIARALTLKPKLLILDESLSALDSVGRDQILQLLRDLALTYIVISHDFELAEDIADEIAVMDLGRIVEYRAAAELLASPRHSITKELVRAHAVLSSRGSKL